MKRPIYTLSDPVSNVVRYVGETSHASRRRKQCLTRSTLCRKHYRVDAWVADLRERGLFPVFEIIEETEARRSRETHWISVYIAGGADLLNECQRPRTPKAEPIGYYSRVRDCVRELEKPENVWRVHRALSGGAA